ncbi:GDSL esterase/lipase like protein [Verticillium longisporum]|uniref:GDSL esterase/lipase like protein n=1 Tax=Verticillium longisporum TaxID=100787 RepID=A0A8I2ZMM0_VERLO|nr:GDSL esterase/lipase like protein [Verticillium longisporum]
MATKPYPQVVLLGDSLFQHAVEVLDGFSFQSQLQIHTIRRLDVINRGFSGYNTANVVQHLDTLFQPPSDTTPKIEYLLVLLGANDAVRPMHTQHVAQDKYRANLAKIITHPAIAAHKPKILLVTPPPVDEIRIEVLDKEKGWPETTRYSAISAQYSQLARDVAAEHEGVVLIDLWKALMDHAVAKTPDYETGAGRPLLGTFESGQRGVLADLLPDGLHMSGEAYRVFYDAVVPHIGTEWVGRGDDDRTGYQLPDWREYPRAE